MLKVTLFWYTFRVTGFSAQLRCLTSSCLHGRIPFQKAELFFLLGIEFPISGHVLDDEVGHMGLFFSQEVARVQKRNPEFSYAPLCSVFKHCLSTL